MNVWKNRHVTQQHISVSTMKAAMIVSIVINRVMVAVEMVRIYVKNVPKDMSYAMECVRVSRNFHFLLCGFTFSVFRLKDLIIFSLL